MVLADAPARDALPLGSLPQVLVVTDVAGRVVATGPRWEALPDEDAPDAPGRPTVLAACAAALRGTSPSVFEVGRRDPSGPVAWYRGEAQVLRDAARQVTGAVALAVDVTDACAEMERLRRAEALLLGAERIARFGTWEWDARGTEVRWSDELYRIFGLSPLTHRPTYASWLERVHPDDRERVRNAMRLAIEQGEPFSHDERVVRADGAVRWLHTWGHPVLDERGRLVRLIGVCQDVTDGKLAMQALERSERQSAAILDSALDAVIVADADGRVLEFNRRAEEIFGWPRDRALGRELAELIVPPALRERHRQALVRRRAGGSTGILGRRVEMEAMRADGSSFPAEIAITEVRVDGDVRYTGFVRDITESRAARDALLREIEGRKRAEASLSAQREVLEELARGASLDVVLDRLCLLVEAQLPGTACTVLLLDPDGEHLHVAAAPSMPAPFNAGLEGRAIGPTAGSCGTSMHRREVVVTEDLTTDPLWADYQDLAAASGMRSCWSRPIESSTGELLGSFAIYGREVRRPDAFETGLIEDASHLVTIAVEHVRTRDLRASLFAEARQLIRFREEFLQIAAHELRTPLTPLKLTLGMLRRRLDPWPAAGSPEVARLKEHLHDAERYVDNLTRLVNGLLEAAQGAEEPVHIHPERFDLAGLTREVLQGMERQLQRSGCEVRLDDEAVVGSWDRLLIRQLVTGLLENARKFGAGRPIRVGVHRRDDHAVLTVEDEGIGIQPEDRARVFQRFERTEGTDHYGGFGLGLHLARRNAEAHGGTIRVENRRTSGATFVVELPLQPVGREAGDQG